MRFVHVLTAAALTLGIGAPSALANEEDLTSFDTCAEVVDFAGGGAGLVSWPAWSEGEGASLGLRTQEPEPDPNANGAMGTGYDGDDEVVAESAETDDSGVSGEDADDVSGTNTQEVGIDEPDLFKTDARLLFVLAGGELRVMTGRTDVPRAIARLPLDLTQGQLLRHGDKLLALGYAPSGRRSVAPDGSVEDRGARYPRISRLIEIDIADRTAPRILRTLDAPGQTIAARQSGSTVRLVISTPTQDGFSYDEEEDMYEEQDLELRDVVPTTRLRSAVTGDRYERRMAPCDQVERPAGFSGNDLLSIFTFDLGRGLVGIRREALMANAQAVYASASTLYIASGQFVDWDLQRGLPEDTFTDVHAFDLTEPGQTTYAGSAQVLGIPLNRYAFSEWDGHLRVATTTEPGWISEAASDVCSDEEDEYDDEGSVADEVYEEDEDAGYCEDGVYSRPSDVPVDNRITVLRREGSAFTQTGLLEGLGRGGSISAVRFDGPRGYVATTAETAPLATLDLADPARPLAAGLLKIPGYSAYLHPLGDGLLLGIGEDRDDDQGQVGGMVSLFDVSDPSQPRRLAKRGLGPGWAKAEYDPHAFLWWPRRKLVLLPYSAWLEGPDSWADGLAGQLVALTASRTDEPNLQERARVSHGPAWDHPGVQRAVVFGDRILSISELGVATNRVSDLRPLGYRPFLPYVQEIEPAGKPRCGSPGQPAPTTPTGTTPTGTTPPTTPLATTPEAVRAAQATTPITPPASPTTPATTPATTPGTSPAPTTPAPACRPAPTPSPTTPTPTTPGTTPGTTPTTPTAPTTPAPTTP